MYLHNDFKQVNISYLVAKSMVNALMLAQNHFKNYLKHIY